MHLAYEIHSILKQGVHIESIAAYGKLVLHRPQNLRHLYCTLNIFESVQFKIYQK